MGVKGVEESECRVTKSIVIYWTAFVALHWFTVLAFVSLFIFQILLYVNRFFLAELSLMNKSLFSIHPPTFKNFFCIHYWCCWLEEDKNVCNILCYFSELKQCLQNSLIALPYSESYLLFISHLIHCRGIMICW